MSRKNINILKNIIQSIIVTMISLILATTALHELSSLLNFEHTVQGDDFQISDVYNNVANSRSVSYLSKDVTIIGLDGSSRNDIATVVSVVDSLQPKAIGLDILFFWEYEGDERLISSLDNCSNLVLPIEIEDDSKSTHGSYFYDFLSTPHFGAINLDSYALSQAVRSFWPSFTVGGRTFNSFGAELVSIAMPEKYQELMARHKESETISYPSVEFMTISYPEFLENPDAFSQDVTGKIILLGDLADGSDFHMTPIDVGTPGVKIHAYIIDTIINNKFITQTPAWLSWVLAFIICFVFVAINFFIGDVSSNLGNLLMRILQVTSLYLFFALGCRIFISHLHYIDFAPSLLMIGLGLFAYDLWMGLFALYELIFKKKK